MQTINLETLLKDLPPQSAQAAASRFSWINHARPEQLTPDGKWRVWLILAGRGWGKTRSGAEDLATWASFRFDERIAVVAPTERDIRETCFEGPSGLCNVLPSGCFTYNRVFSEIVLWNGCRINGYSSEKPDRLRGPNFARAWADEISSWSRDEDTWNMLNFALRIGDNPQIVATTTPKPKQLIRDLLEREGKDVVITRGTTYDNRENLSPAFFEDLKKYEGTQLGRQELHGEVIDLEEMGIFKRSWFPLWPNDKPLPEFDLIITSVDCAYSEKQEADYTASVVLGVFNLIEGKQQKAAIVLDCWHEQIAYPDLRRAIMKEYQTKYGKNDKPVDILLIEEKAAGISLIQDLRAANMFVRGFNPGNMDKVQRAHLVSYIAKDGHVLFPESDRRKGKPKDWMTPFIEEIVYFPHGRNDDFVDALVNALMFLQTSRMIAGAAIRQEESYWRRNMKKSVYS